jgi:hypothetical protein
MIEMKQPSVVLVSKSCQHIGTCVHEPGKGWRFVTSLKGRGDSRKLWKDDRSCIPKWAWDEVDEMLTVTEWAERQIKTR